MSIKITNNILCKIQGNDKAEDYLCKIDHRSLAETPFKITKDPVSRIYDLPDGYKLIKFEFINDFSPYFVVEGKGTIEYLLVNSGENGESGGSYYDLYYSGAGGSGGEVASGFSEIDARPYGSLTVIAQPAQSINLASYLYCSEIGYIKVAWGGVTPGGARKTTGWQNGAAGEDGFISDITGNPIAYGAAGGSGARGSGSFVPYRPLYNRYGGAGGSDNAGGAGGDAWIDRKRWLMGNKNGLNAINYGCGGGGGAAFFENDSDTWSFGNGGLGKSSIIYIKYKPIE